MTDHDIKVSRETIGMLARQAQMSVHMWLEADAGARETLALKGIDEGTARSIEAIRVTAESQLEAAIITVLDTVFGGGSTALPRTSKETSEEWAERVIATLEELYGEPVEIFNAEPIPAAEGILRLKTAEEYLRTALGDDNAHYHRAAWRELHPNECGSLDGYQYEGGKASTRAIADSTEALLPLIDWDFEREVQVQFQEDERRRSSRVLRAGLVDIEGLRQLAEREDPSVSSASRPEVVGYIYSITMPDGECYVGKTTREPAQRWEEHREMAVKDSIAPVYLALRYWEVQGRSDEVAWRTEENVLGWGPDDLDVAEKRWIRGMGTLNVMDSVKAATLYPNVSIGEVDWEIEDSDIEDDLDALDAEDDVL